VTVMMVSTNDMLAITAGYSGVSKRSRTIRGPGHMRHSSLTSDIFKTFKVRIVIVPLVAGH
jgi:hypothetical protein